jgi:hypothetical protein
MSISKGFIGQSSSSGGIVSIFNSYVKAVRYPALGTYAFYYTGAVQNILIPSDTMTAHLIGGAGGGGSYTTARFSGPGGYTTITATGLTGHTLDIYVGGGGQGGSRISGEGGGNGGWPNGGSGSRGDTGGGGGGGRSEISIGNMILAIAGGGGGNAGYGLVSGAGGGLTAEAGQGGAGNQYAGGLATAVLGTGITSSHGSFRRGGVSNAGDQITSSANDDGAGGDGLFGGGSGSGDGQGGGGGSGFISSFVTGSTYTSTINDRPAEVLATIDGIDTGTYGNGVESTSSTAVRASSGNDGLVIITFS